MNNPFSFAIYFLNAAPPPYIIIISYVNRYTIGKMYKIMGKILCKIFIDNLGITGYNGYNIKNRADRAVL